MAPNSQEEFDRLMAQLKEHNKRSKNLYELLILGLATPVLALAAMGTSLRYAYVSRQRNNHVPVPARKYRITRNVALTVSATLIGAVLRQWQLTRRLAEIPPHLLNDGKPSQMVAQQQTQNQEQSNWEKLREGGRESWV